MKVKDILDLERNKDSFSKLFPHFIKIARYNMERYEILTEKEFMELPILCDNILNSKEAIPGSFLKFNVVNEKAKCKIPIFINSGELIDNWQERIK